MSKNKYAHIDAMNSAELSAYVDGADNSHDGISHDEHAHAVKVLSKRSSA